MLTLTRFPPSFITEIMWKTWPYFHCQLSFNWIRAKSILVFWPLSKNENVDILTKDLFQRILNTATINQLLLKMISWSKREDCNGIVPVVTALICQLYIIVFSASLLLLIQLLIDDQSIMIKTGMNQCDSSVSVSSASQRWSKIYLALRF